MKNRPPKNRYLLKARAQDTKPEMMVPIAVLTTHNGQKQHTQRGGQRSSLVWFCQLLSYDPAADLQHRCLVRIEASNEDVPMNPADAPRMPNARLAVLSLSKIFRPIRILLMKEETAVPTNMITASPKMTISNVNDLVSK